MKHLLDTHTFLWFVSDSPKLSEKARNLIIDPTNDFYVSLASLWEISIKVSIGKLELKGDYRSVIDDVTSNDFILLPINFAHTVCLSSLPFLHRDPFDRMLIAQAITERLPMVGKDKVFDRYEGIERIW